MGAANRLLGISSSGSTVRTGSLNQLPPTPEKEMLRSFLKDASKWVVIVGYDQENMRWSDIAHNSPKSTIEAEFVVQRFGIL